MSELAKSLAKRLAEQIERRGIQKTTLCSRTKISRPKLDRYLAGQIPSIKDLEALFNELEMEAFFASDPLVEVFLATLPKLNDRGRAALDIFLQGTLPSTGEYLRIASDSKGKLR